ncbi:MAG: hypothetical protein ABSF77_00230 [Spirochaetia bacterium]|jgi:hypothetical protein
MDFNYQFDEYSENFFAGRDYCLLGNGFLQVIAQLKNNFGASGNALLLNMISSDEYRSRRFWLLSHHAFKELPSCVAIRSGERLYCADSRQIGTQSLSYTLSFDTGVPALVVRWDALHELDRDVTPRINDSQIEDVSLAPGNIGLVPAGGAQRRPRASLRITERIWCPLDAPVLVREVTMENRGKEDASDLEVWFFLAPNKLFLPEGRIMAGNDCVACGYWGGARQFLALASAEGKARLVLAEYPGAVDAVLTGRNAAAEKIVNPFMGAHLAAGLPVAPLSKGASCTVRFVLAYGKTEEEMLAALRAVRAAGVAHLAASDAGSWERLTSVRTGDPDVDELYSAAKAGLRASVSRHEKSGRINSGILQYDTEWSRDTDFIAAAAVMNGQHDIARSIIAYALENLTDERGYCSCGAAWEGRDRDYQIDTNGIRLWSLWLYLAWTGDETLLRSHWSRIQALIGAFFDASRWVGRAGMIASSRDCWERWKNCGLEPGFELHHQHWSALGLEKASEMAALVGDAELADRCLRRSRQIWSAVLDSPKYALVQAGHFIKRRSLDGTVPLTANAYRGARKGFLEPDTSELQPILSGLVEGSSALARSTLQRMKPLWNQDGLWRCGGYTRYNITSDPEFSSGPWPGITLMVARAALATRQWKIYKRAMSWVAGVARPTWTLFEHFDFAAPDKTNRRWYRGGIIPWLSFAEPSFLVVHELLGFRASLHNVRISPSMPPNMKRLQASVPFRGHRVRVEVINNGGACTGVAVDGKSFSEFDERGAAFRPFTRDVAIRMTLGARRARG